LGQLKDEIVDLLDQYDERRVRAEDEIERLRRVEHEANAREIAEIRKELPAINRLQNEMSLRQAEEARLANLIGILQNRIPAVESKIETWASDLAYLEEAESKNNRSINEIQTTLVEINKRWEPLNNRVDRLEDRLNKMGNNVDAIIEAQSELRQSIKNWAEQIQMGEYERNQRLNNWERMLDQQQDMMESYQQQWVNFSDQYKEAKMAVQTLTEWQRQIEQQQQETAELARVEINRMQTRWDNFVVDRDKRLKSFEVDVEQRLMNANRHERKMREQLNTLDEKMDTLEKEQEKVWRVQSAQADAIKQIPRIWQEEIEKTLANDPNRRRQPALVPVRDDEL
jgi:chromosome segregation ATPase